MNTKQIFIATTAASLLGLVSSNAHAFVLPGGGWDRPVLRAEMSVLDTQGNPPAELGSAKNVELVMTQQDGTTAPSGFILLIDGQSKQSYQVTSISKDPCGSTIYALAPIQGAGSYVLDGATQKLQVTDAAGSACPEQRRHRWELDVQSVDLAHQISGQMQWIGDPQSVINPM